MIILGITTIVIIAGITFLAWVNCWNTFRADENNNHRRWCKKCGASQSKWNKTMENGRTQIWWVEERQGKDPHCKCKMYTGQLQSIGENTLVQLAAKKKETSRHRLHPVHFRSSSI
jgi:hypothetical protein